MDVDTESAHGQGPRPETADGPLRVALVVTAAPSSCGSMARYAALVERALCEGDSGLSARPVRIDLAPDRLHGPARHAWIMGAAMRRWGRCEADLYHIVDGSHAYVARWLPRAPIVVTAHDVIPLLQKRGLLGDRAPGVLAGWLIARSVLGLRAADHVVADSENTRRDVCEHAGVDRSCTSVVHLPVEAQMRCEAEWRDRRASAGAYVLHVGNDAFYKNRMGVLRIFARVRVHCEVALKMVGPPPDDKLLGTVRGLGLAERVEFVVAPGEEQLWELYRNACLFLFPSLYEGFGWPPLEAMACGCPVVCSSAASLPEVVGDAALTDRPGDEQALARHCLNVLRDESLALRLAARGRERVKKFSLAAMAKGLVEAYGMALARHASPSRNSK